jgi:FkbH-like protein
VDSFVFVDDNPAERAIVAAQVEGIAVPDVGADVSSYPGTIEAGRYFEPASLSQEDLERAELYAENTQRSAFESKFADYGEYLDSLEMSAEIDVFKPVYLERIAQLTNKTNQFNLTTRRYTLAEIEEIATDRRYIGLYGKLSDRFGDNGLISIVLGRKEGATLHLDLWLMSCRVLKRDMEFAMLDAIVQHAQAAGIETLLGYYLPTKKNGMVADHYEKLGFTRPSASTADASVFALSLPGYTPKNHHIKVMELIHG